ncbi:CpaF family protein [Candidatus Micrarchaeota archaeon]|nr:CpaF family protein [Candidatus Micrarchaeota archaeon]
MTYLDKLVRKAKSEKPTPDVVKRDDAPKKGERVLLQEYGNVKIYRDFEDPMPTYEVPTPHYRGDEKVLLDALMEIAVSVVTVDATALTVEEKKKQYYSKVIDIIDQTPELNIPVNAKEFFANAVVQEMVGYGLIDPLVKDDFLEEIMIIGPNKPVYVYHRKHEMLKTNIVFYDDKDIRDLVDRIARAIGRRIDTQVPLLDARLGDGTRVNATLPPISLEGATLTLRKFKADPLSVIDLVNHGTMSYELAAFLWLATDGAGAYPANILIAGGTASGKTTTLNVLASFIPNNERIISIEDTAELNLPLNHWIRMEVRPPSIEGTGEITMNDLVKNSLRMRPDRILVGEVRGAEGYTMFAAMNTGHRGVMGTVHANSAKETLVRLNSPPISVPTIMLDSLNLILMQNRIQDRRKGLLRRVTEVAEIISSDGANPEVRVIYSWDPAKDVIYSTDNNSVYVQTLMRFTGMTKDAVDKEIEERVKILKELNAQQKRSIDEVTSVTQGYVQKKRALL